MKWINFNEQKPKNGQWVIIYSVYFQSKGLSVIQFNSKKKFQIINRCCDCEVDIKDITHWSEIVVPEFILNQEIIYERE